MRGAVREPRRRCVSLQIYVYMHTYMCTCMHICVHVCIFHVCIRANKALVVIHIYIYIYIHICLCILYPFAYHYIHLHTCVSMHWSKHCLAVGSYTPGGATPAPTTSRVARTPMRQTSILDEAKQVCAGSCILSKYPGTMHIRIACCTRCARPLFSMSSCRLVCSSWTRTYIRSV